MEDFYFCYSKKKKVLRQVGGLELKFTVQIFSRDTQSKRWENDEDRNHEQPDENNLKRCVRLIRPKRTREYHRDTNNAKGNGSVNKNSGGDPLHIFTIIH